MVRRSFTAQDDELMLELIGLTKKFGSITAVDNLSFTVQKGEIFGLLGENGAGKTTTLRMLATMLKPTSGTARLAGIDIVKAPEEVRGRVGILFGGESGLYDRLTVYENIQYFRGAHSFLCHHDGNAQRYPALYVPDPNTQYHLGLQAGVGRADQLHRPHPGSCDLAGLCGAVSGDSRLHVQE